MVETTLNPQTFETFLHRWFIRLQHYLEHLHRAIEEDEDEHRCKDLIDRVAAHYGDYFRAKGKIVKQDVFLVLTPTWFSSFERAYLWLGGFRPGLIIRIAVKNVVDLTDEQLQRMQRLMAEIKEEEKQATDEFNRVQEGMVSPAMVELARHLGKLQNGEERNMNSAVDSLKLATEAVVESADYLRKKACITVLEILKPAQAVRFLAAAAQLQLRLRWWGMQRDVQNARLVQ